MLTPTYTFTPSPPLTREALTYTRAIDYVQSATRTGMLRRPVYRFTVKLKSLTRSQAQCLSAIHAYHQGSVPFLWGGGEYGRQDNYNLVGEGDGVTVQYYLANRYIGASSISVQTLRRATGVTSTWAVSSTNGWPMSLNPGPGILTFANSTNTVPVSGDDLLARYGCQYLCTFDRNELKLEEIARGVYTATLKLQESLLDNAY